MGVNRFEVYLIDLDPTRGSEINKMRPCVVVSPNETNDFLRTVIVAPLTSTIKDYPTRINCRFDGKAGQVALDQVRTVDKTRLIRKMGVMDETTGKLICSTFQDLFQY